MTKTVVETATFGIRKIRDPGISGSEYQQGFWNVREYVLFRDGHICQCCKGRSRDRVLNVHHIESRKAGGDAPNNLIILFERCHKGYHAGAAVLPKGIRQSMTFRDAAFMCIMRWSFYNRLGALYPDVSLTYGYITKHTRIEHGLPKEHFADARCVSGHPDARPAGEVFFQKQVR